MPTKNQHILKNHENYADARSIRLEKIQYFKQVLFTF